MFDRISGIYPAELKLNKVNFSADTEAPFLYLNLSISVSTVYTNIYDNFYFNILNFTFIDGDVPEFIEYMSRDMTKPTK